VAQLDTFCFTDWVGKGFTPGDPLFVQLFDHFFATVAPLLPLRGGLDAALCRPKLGAPDGSRDGAGTSARTDGNAGASASDSTGASTSANVGASADRGSGDVADRVQKGL
jgi:hypothetical protein